MEPLSQIGQGEVDSVKVATTMLKQLLEKKALLAKLDDWTDVTALPVLPGLDSLVRDLLGHALIVIRT